MKTLKLFITGAILFSFAMSAQITRTGQKIPSWGVPVTSERYYYLPDIHTYYDTRTGQYVHLRNGNWVRSNTVPTAYKNYDFKRGRKVVIKDYRGNAPYSYYNIHRVKYAPARAQQTLPPVVNRQTKPRVVNQETRPQVVNRPVRRVNQETRPQVVNQQPRPRVINDDNHDHKHGKGHSKGKGKGHSKGHGKGHSKHGHGKGHGHDHD